MQRIRHIYSFTSLLGQTKIIIITQTFKHVTFYNWTFFLYKKNNLKIQNIQYTLQLYTLVKYSF